MCTRLPTVRCGRFAPSACGCSNPPAPSCCEGGLTSGLTLSYPLYYDWPEAPEAYRETTSYLFGPAMLVAPIVDWQAAPRAVWLPPGTWVEWCTNTSAIYNGPVTLPPRQYSRGEIPVFVRGGSVVPTKGLADAVVPPVAPGRLILLAFPGGPPAGQPQPPASVFEDAGEGLDYLSGAYWRMDVTQDARAAGSGLGISVVPHAGGSGYASERPLRALTVQFLLDPASPVPAVTGVAANGVAVPEAASPDSPPPVWRLQHVGPYNAVVVELADAPSSLPVRVTVALLN